MLPSVFFSHAWKIIAAEIPACSPRRGGSKRFWGSPPLSMMSGWSSVRICSGRDASGGGGCSRITTARTTTTPSARARTRPSTHPTVRPRPDDWRTEVSLDPTAMPRSWQVAMPLRRAPDAWPELPADSLSCGRLAGCRTASPLANEARVTLGRPRPPAQPVPSLPGLSRGRSHRRATSVPFTAA